METVINSPGLFHITKKIITFMNYRDKKYLATIKSLRLVCNSWKNIIESKELCKFWQNILLQRPPLNEDVDFKYSDLIYSICDQAFANNDGKCHQWKVIHFILLYISHTYCKQSWPSVDKNIWHNSNNFEKIVKHFTSKPSTIEMVFLFCNGSPELLALIPKTIRLDIKTLLSFAMYNFCQKDTVKHLLNYHFEAICGPKTLIMKLSWRIINCQFNFPQQQTVKEHLTKVLAVFIEHFPDVTAECISQVDNKYMKTEFESRTDMIPNGTWSRPIPSMGRINGSASIETLVRVGIEKENGLGPESKMVVLHDFTPCVDDELEVKRGQVVHVLYQENDWVYVISENNQEGFIPHSYCAAYGSQMASLALNVKKKLPRDPPPTGLQAQPQQTVIPSDGSPCQLVPKELAYMDFYNPLLTALHYDKDHQLNNMINLFATVLIKVRYPQGIKLSVLGSLNFYAALKGYREIAEIVAEKVGPNMYANLSIVFMQNCICWIDENVLKFMAFIIDQDDWQKITNSEDSSLHVAAKKKNWQFIKNFAPFSTTIFEKGKEGRNALLLSLRSSLDITQRVKIVSEMFYHGMKKSGYF